MIENLELVIFDMDGLMFDTERAYCDAMLALTDRLQIEVDMNVLYRAIGTSNFDEDLFFYQGVPDGFDKKDLVSTATLDFINDMCINGVPKKPGLDELLARLKERGIKMVVATSTPINRSGRLLESAGVTPFLEFIITGNEVRRGKPFPDIFLAACEKAGVTTDRALVLEDSNAGGKAAHAAGIKYIIVPDLIETEEDVANSAFAVMGSLFEVRDMLFS